MKQIPIVIACPCGHETQASSGHVVSCECGRRYDTAALQAHQLAAAETVKRPVFPLQMAENRPFRCKASPHGWSMWSALSGPLHPAESPWGGMRAVKRGDAGQARLLVRGQ